MHVILKEYNLSNIVKYYNYSYDFYKIFYKLEYIKLLGLTLHIKIKRYTKKYSNFCSLNTYHIL